MLDISIHLRTLIEAHLKHAASSIVYTSEDPIRQTSLGAMQDTSYACTVEPQ